MERRTLLGHAVVLAGAAAAAGCAAEDPAAIDSSAPEPTNSATPTTSSASDRVILGPTSDIPVGGGKVYKAEGVVVTQPQPGDFRAFGLRCPHQGCSVSAVTSEGIVCPCHNSLFSVSDGSPTAGPADAPLMLKSVTLDGDNIILS